MKRAFLVPAMVALAAAAISLPVAGAERTRLPEAAPLPFRRRPSRRPRSSRRPRPSEAADDAPFPVGWEDDVYCAGWIGAMDEPVTGRIVAAEYEDSRAMFGVGDIVYSDVGARDGLMAGQEFWVIRPAHEVYRAGLRSSRPSAASTSRRPARRVVCVQDDDGHPRDHGIVRADLPRRPAHPVRADPDSPRPRERAAHAVRRRPPGRRPASSSR